VATGHDSRVGEAPGGVATHVFADQASSTVYAQHFDPAFGRRFAEKTVDALAVGRGSRVLEVACGTGVFARTAAHVVGPAGSVIAIDPSAGAIAAAERIDVTSSVQWRSDVGPPLPFDECSFDVVACQHALHRLDDAVDALQDMRRVLAPGGRLGITTWGPIEENPAFAALLDATIRSGFDESGVVEAILDVFSYHRVDDIRDLAHKAGFTDVTSRTVRMLAALPRAAQWVHVYPLLPPLSESWRRAGPLEREQFLARASELLRPFEHDGVLRVQASARLVVARAPLF
jgi:ubiquinone/menaquinone biosynthesis C-methylase UbiE